MFPVYQTSSRNLFQNVSWRWYFKTAVSNLYIAISLYEHDICGPFAVPSVFRKFLLLKIKLLHVKQSFKPSKIHSIGGVLLQAGFETSETDYCQC